MNVAEFGIICWEILNCCVIPTQNDNESTIESLRRISDMVNDYDAHSTLKDVIITVNWDDENDSR